MRAGQRFQVGAACGRHVPAGIPGNSGDSRSDKPVTAKNEACTSNRSDPSKMDTPDQ
jgi:hypothetical protein